MAINLKGNNEAVVTISLILLVLFILAIILIPLIISLVWGFLTFVGLCLLIAAAFIFWKEKGKVSFNRTSVFMWLVLFGVLLVIVGPYTGSLLPTIDFSVIPGAERLSMNLL